MSKRITLISRFDENSHNQIKEIINRLGQNKDICKVPFGKVDDRYKADTLPFHFTMCAWDIKDEESIISKLNQLNFPELKVKITGLNIMPGKEKSHCLYFELENNENLKELQKEIYSSCPSRGFKPGNFTFHITIHIDKDRRKIDSMKKILEKDFKEAELVVENFGLYEIYPAKLVKIF